MDAKVAWDDADVWERSGFNAFLKANGISRSDLIPQDSTVEELRFFRVKRGLRTTTLTEDDVIERVFNSLKDQLGEAAVRPGRVDWVPGFFSLPATTRLASIDLYQQGELYGIDVSSGYAVSLLDIQPGEHVLDLCCAPGAKLTMIADLLQMRGSVTGVDYSRSRIGACKQLVHKYKLVHPQGEDNVASSEVTRWRCRLYHADGRTFKVGPMAPWDAQYDGAFEVVLDSDEITSRSAKSQGRKRKNKSARAREAKLLKAANASAVVAATSQDESTEDRPASDAVVLYDKVLVDAECTHDGSIKHLQKLDTEAAWTEYVADHLNDSELGRIITLQHDLIRNGFKLLREGGTMIYSTCSLSVKQNENIVRAFLDETPSAKLVPVDTKGIPCEPGQLEGTVRFTPAHHTSGLFISMIRKVSADSVTTAI